MTPTRPKYETLLFSLTFFLALFMRFFQLGALPLGDNEAEWALQALGVAQGMRPLLGTQSAYVSLTAVLFFLFEPTNLLARLLPALTGSLLVLVVYLARERLQPLPGLLLAFFLALDPGLVALSRQAGSLMPALAFSMLAWALFSNQRPRLAGVLVGLALLSGPGLWAGVLGLLLAWMVYCVMESGLAQRAQIIKNTGVLRNLVSIRFEDIQPSLIYAGATILLVGSSLFLSPAGLSAWVSSLPIYLSG